MADKRNSRDVLIEAASRLFRLRGYYGVGLNDILEESGIPKGSLYYYFPKGKEQLVIEAINHTKNMVISSIKQVLENIEDPIEAIQTQIVQLSKDIVGSDQRIGLPIGTIAGETYSTSEPIRLACQLAFEDLQSIYKKKLLQSGYGEQQSEDLSIIINGLIEGGILLSLTKQSGQPLQIIAERIPLLFAKK